jgi:hypothetical protein
MTYCEKHVVSRMAGEGQERCAPPILLVKSVFGANLRGKPDSEPVMIRPRIHGGRIVPVFIAPCNTHDRLLDKVAK